MRTLIAVASSLLLALPAVAASAPPQEKPPIERLSLEELMDVEVVSASNTGEKISRAPATVIVISRDDIEARGYRDLSQILDDLPGMEVVRPYGATYMKNYWRGYRNTVGDPFLLLMDGIIFNHLYFNTADVMVTFPLTNIERVEVVYGPASSVYGANAFMGVINVITRSDPLEKGSKADIRLAGGSFGTRLADMTYFYRREDLRLRVSGRLDDGDLDPASGNRYEYTKDHYYADPALWGNFAQNPSLGGSFSSPHQHRAVDVRAWLGSLEAGVQYFRTSSGYGLEYAADRSQIHAVWARPDLSAFLRYQHRFSEELGSTTLVRYRSSDVSNDSYFVENRAGNGEPRSVDFSYWSSTNSSVSLFQDFDYQHSPRLSFTGGFKYEQKDLQKAYETTYGPSLPPDAVDSHYPYPQPPATGADPQNRVTTEDVGVYVQTWYQLSSHNQLNVGLRSDDNSIYGRANTLRAGYVGNFGPWTLKTLYGEAFQEPNNRLLYGGWDGSGSDPRLDPETSHTLEMSGGYSRNNLFTLLSVYHVANQNTFVNTAAGAQNLGDRRVVGLDYHLQRLFDLAPHRSVKVWGYYSRIFSARETIVSDSGGMESGDQNIGDLAQNKVLAGATFRANHATATLRGRWIDHRPTVASNPVRDVPSYTTIDANFRWDDLFAKGIGVSLSIENLTDTHYAQPGVRDASAGTTPGGFDANGDWTGSAGFYNSLLPQPGRSAVLSVHLTME